MRHLDIYLLLLLFKNDYILKAHGYNVFFRFLLSQQSIYIYLYFS